LAPAQPSELQARLSGLAAPRPLVEWARPFADLGSCWDACSSPQWLLWLAARLCTTSDERRAVVACLAELTKRAEHAGRCTEPAVGPAVATATAWVRGEASLDDLLSAEGTALAAAERAADVAAEEGARARALFSSAPRPRPSSFATSRAMGAWVEWRQAEYLARLARAAAGTARAAAEAAWIDAIRAGGVPFASDSPGSSPGKWVNCAAEAAGYAVSALAIAQGGRNDDRTVRKSARLIRQHLPCPTLD
jgi:hypothetical protein